jgi:RHH-type transcriptional regulator, proline utilization regulon repressor / proline dehydrogenase / delta 1-pyrroline-5-carboxylate dehydrogenase
MVNWILEDELSLLPNFSAIDEHLFAEETQLVGKLAKEAKLDSLDAARVNQSAERLVKSVRGKRHEQGGIDAFMQEYSLSSEEGVVLMCLAEALLRIPDAATADKLIADKIGGRDWQLHLGKSESLFVNASAWGLLLTGKFVEISQNVSTDGFGFLKQLVRKSGEPILRGAMKQAMRIMGRQFVLGETIDQALDAARGQEKLGYRYSYDMLGESAMTMADAERYFAAYKNALSKLGSGATSGDVFSRPSLSVKLSALHPRYEEKQGETALKYLHQLILELAQQAKLLNVGLTIDAEEAHRLELSLMLFGRVACEPSLRGWNGLGLAVQAYSRRARPVLDWLVELAKLSGRVLPVRLVKGAYWDTEIKRAQEAGFENYPVFTRKVSTDVSYLACARFLLSRPDAFYPQFATHNAQTVAAVAVMAGAHKHYEFQRLHGMGQGLYGEVIAAGPINQPCRIYAPVGSHKDLLAYLVRRLLENGANTSFVNRLADDELPVSAIIADPVAVVSKLTRIPNPHIPFPAQIFSLRENSKGIALWRKTEREKLLAVSDRQLVPIAASALIGGVAERDGPQVKIYSPQDHRFCVGEIHEAGDTAIARAMDQAALHQEKWNQLGGATRAVILERAAALIESHTQQLSHLLVREAGKTWDNALGDLREAVDFLRYYAAGARTEFSAPVVLPGPTGEQNELSLHGRGVFVCISPWNFPLAIFTGQVAAALAAGNAVVAKPAEQTPLIAFEAVKLLHEAGVPPHVLQFLPGDGARIGKLVLAHPKLAGVAFTGSTETARIINRALAERKGTIPVLIAETGGMNAMIVDSSALAEQAVRDVMASAFDSAGQRCSAARILFVQDDIADHVVAMLKGAMQELVIGDPLDYSTDIGPVIDQDAREMLMAHKAKMAKSGKLIFDVLVPSSCAHGTYVGPAAFEIPSIDVLEGEVFGPILHVVRFAGDRLGFICEEINRTGYGLTLGLHTRLESVVAEVSARVRVGNLYVNRNQIGAVVGAQPFGGEGLSGTGPKAGGPNYLKRFAVERVRSIDTTASGGNSGLLSIASDEE